MAAKLGQKKKGQKVKKPVQPVNDIEKDSNVVLTKTPEEVNVKRDKAKGAEKSNTGFFAFFRKFDTIAMSCFIAIILAGVVVIGAYVNTMYINSPWDSPVAVDGDKVKVEYVGSYGNYYDKEGAVIFDTNMESVNDSDCIKGISYVDKNKFEYLEFEVGGTTVIKGFSDAVIGDEINWTSRVKIDPADGYGDATKYAFSTTNTFNIGGTMSLEDFNDYASVSLKASDFTNGKQTVTMPIGLDAVVASASNGNVTYSYIVSDLNELKTSGELKDTKVDENVQFKVTEVIGTTFTVEYDVDNTLRMYKCIVNHGGAETEVLVNDFDQKDTFKYKILDGSDNEEQKGEYLYFYIKIIDINGYAGA